MSVLLSVDASARWTHAIYRFNGSFDTMAVEYYLGERKGPDDSGAKAAIEKYLNSTEIIDCYSNEECTIINHTSVDINGGEGLRLSTGEAVLMKSKELHKQQTIIRYSDSIYCNHIFRNSIEEWHSYKMSWGNCKIRKTGKTRRINQLDCQLYRVVDSVGRTLDFYLSGAISDNTNPGWMLPRVKGGVVLITNGKASISLVSFNTAPDCPYMSNCKGNIENHTADMIGSLFFRFYHLYF